MFLHIVDREKAKEIGMKNFFNLKPCRPFGNVAMRNTKTGRCLCAEHRKKHSDKQKRILLENPEALKRKREKFREWRDKNKDEFESCKKRSIERAIQEGRKYKHSQKTLERMRKYRRDNMHKLSSKKMIRFIKDKYPDAILNISELDIFVTEECYHLRMLRIKSTGIDWNVDHMKPLGGNPKGMHTWDNLQVIPFYLNIMKRNRNIFTKPHEWFNYA